MAIRFYCTNCGQKIKAQDDMPGLKIACPTCRERQVVPQPAVPKSTQRTDQQALKMAAHFDDKDYSTTPKGYHSDRRKDQQPDDHSEPLNQVKKKRIARGSLYFFFILAFIPLGIDIYQGHDDNLIKQIEQSIQNDLHGEKQRKAYRTLEQAKKGQASLDDILEYFPNKKLKTAWLPRDTNLHYYLALVTTIGFLLIVCFCLPKGFTRAPLMLIVGTFTAIFGIGSLMLLQILAVSGWGMVLAGPFGIIIYMIGICYRAIMQPDLPFITYLFSFTFGVGLCEEIIKALPIFIIFLGRSRMRWHECCALGMASGIGFGIAEGIHFSETMYNGLCDQQIYFVRFISCVMLHAIWCAAAALFLHRHQRLTHGRMSVLEGFKRLFILIAIPMVLHGLYDTFLTKRMDGLALAVALFSFGWLVLMIESAREKEGDILVQVPTVAHESTPLHEQTTTKAESDPFAHATSPSPV